MRADEWKVTMQPEKENDMRDPSDPYEEAFPDFRAAMDKALAAIEKFRNGEVSREEHDAVLKEAKGTLEAATEKIWAEGKAAAVRRRVK
jgi:hypothetical protein